MTCKDCINCDKCPTGLACSANPTCGMFKPKSHFVELPCEVGQTVWFETWAKNGSVCIGVQPHTVDKIEIACVVGMNKFVPTRLEDWRFGKTVFLSREEAEKALSERSK